MAPAVQRCKKEQRRWSYGRDRVAARRYFRGEKLMMCLLGDLDDDDNGKKKKKKKQPSAGRAATGVGRAL